MNTFLSNLAITTATCLALSAQNSDQYSKCMSKADTQTSMHACANEEALRADAELNEVYKRLLSAARNNPAAVKKIVTAEKAWIAYRDAYIDATYPATDKQAEYGSWFPMQVDLLRAKLTRQQVDAIKDLLKQYQGAAN